MQPLFTCLIILQFLVIVLHDMVHIPGWTHGGQVKAVIGHKKFWIATLLNAIFPGIAVGLAIYFWNQPRPPRVVTYWVYYCAITLGSAITMWYIPYFFGCSRERKLEYARMYAGTRQVLPARGDNPCPNLLHVYFHILFVINMALVLMMRFGRF
jgi:hypothetical protein